MLQNPGELIVLRKFPDYFTDLFIWDKERGWLDVTRFKLIKCPLYISECLGFFLEMKWSPPPPNAHTFKNVTTFSDLESLCSYRYIYETIGLNQWISCPRKVILNVFPRNKKKPANISIEKPKFYLTFKNHNNEMKFKLMTK